MLKLMGLYFPIVWNVWKALLEIHLLTIVACFQPDGGQLAISGSDESVNVVGDGSLHTHVAKETQAVLPITKCTQR